MDTTQTRRGVFPTPLPFAKKACEYLDFLLGKHGLQSGQCRLWDMAAGTGNLELELPQNIQQFCYLSTLEHDDVKHLTQKFPNATSFQYNYLEDDADKIPQALLNDLDNPKIKWIILLNPPYATAQEAGLQGKSKEGVAHTKIRKQMHDDGLGEVSRELYVQFLYRIMNDFKHRSTVLGLFAPLKYLVSANYQRFRERIFRATFHSGFMFSSENFGGTSKSKHFPVSFILWDIGQKIPTESQSEDGRMVSEQAICLDILDNTTHKIGTKTIRSATRNQFLSRWIQRPRATQVFPPFGSALTVKTGNVDTRNRIADGFLASLMCPGNELQSQPQTAFLSGPQASAGALSVTPDNFEQAVVVFAARRIPKDTWFNHVDQLMMPNQELPPQFITDCAVWSLFDGKNQTASLRNVMYQNCIYQVANHFFPFSVSEIAAWPMSDDQIAASLCGADDSFVADWLCKRELSEPSQNVLDCARRVYRHYFAHLRVLRRLEFKIERYDAGWYQIQRALRDAECGTDLLAEIRQRHDVLGEQILPALCAYGITADGIRLPFGPSQRANR
ncbi:MAG: hypothetical protein FWG73_01745 [Planctomycetaceae bacterium]|nr:hypothetical protein [Planctomycetaceae bacterium]